MIRVVSLSPELPLASAPATQGVTIIPNSALSYCKDNEKLKHFLALYHEQRPANCFAKRFREPWENAFENRLENGIRQHSFKMPITTTKLSKNKTSRQCMSHRRLVTLSLQEQHPLLGPFLGIAMDRGSFRKTGAGLNPRQDHVLNGKTDHRYHQTLGSMASAGTSRKISRTRRQRQAPRKIPQKPA